MNRSAEELAAGVMEDNSFVSAFMRCENITELTRPLLLELAEEILVDEDGGIKIVFRFQDAFEKAMRYIEMNGETVRTA